MYKCIMGKEFHLGDTLQDLAATQGTGSLFIQTDGKTGRIFLREGRIIHSASEEHRGLDALSLLARHNLVEGEWTPDMMAEDQTLDETVDEIMSRFPHLNRDNDLNGDEKNDSPNDLEEETEDATSSSKEATTANLKDCAIAISVQSGNSKGKVFYITKPETSLGRAKSCDIVLDDHTISNRHCKFTADERGLRVSDLGSLNGTIVLGKKGGEISLQPGDEIHMGGICLKISFKVRRSARITQAVDKHITTTLNREGLISANKSDLKSRFCTKPITWRNIPTPKTHNNKHKGVEGFIRKIIGS